MIQPCGTLLTVVDPPTPDVIKTIILPEGAKDVVKASVVLAVGPDVHSVDKEIEPGRLVYHHNGCGTRHGDVTIMDVQCVLGWEDDARYELTLVD